MGKLKTHKGASKRFRKTKKGKYTHGIAGYRHMLTGKSGNLKRKKRRGGVVAKPGKRLLDRLLPYA